jgi:hypothetical protein
MAKFVIEEPGKPKKWIKNIDKGNQKLEFTDTESEAYVRDGGFYPKAELEFVKHYFMEEYPELAHCNLDSDW